MKNTVNLYVKTAFALIYFSVIIRHVKGGIVQDLSLLDAKDRVLTENGKELLPQSMESPTSQNKEQAYPPIMKLNQSLDCQLSYLPSDDGKCLVSMQFRGQAPAWFLERFMPNEMPQIARSFLKTFAEEQMCGCPSPSASDSCPEDLQETIELLVNTCDEKLLRT